jgi:hypothetical protein
VSVSQALERIRQTARQRKKEKFTALFHHVSIDHLEEAFFELEIDARRFLDEMRAHPSHRACRVHDLRGRVIGQPEISTDGFLPYRNSIRDTFGDSASQGVIVKTYSVTHLVKEAQGRYSPAAVVAVEREVASGDADQYSSTSYVERQNLSLRMGQRRFTRLTNGFSKKLDNHVAAVALYVAHYNLCRTHEALKTTPAKALGVVGRTWAIGELIDAALATQPITPIPTAPERRKGFRVIQGGRD